MRTSAIFVVSLFALVGCGDNSSGPLSSVPSQVTNGPVGPASSTPYSRSEGDQSVSAAQQLSTGGGVQVAEARSSVGAPVIYSTTGGPLPDAKRAGHVQIGANVTPLPDWKRSDRWSDPVNGVSISTGQTYDGARGAQIAEYVIPHIDDQWEPQGYANEPATDTPGLATFPNQPVLRLAEGTSKEHSAYALHAAALINSTLPHNKRILIGPEAPPLVSVDQIPDGQIFVDFAAKSDWIPSSEGSAMNATGYSWEWVPRQDSGCPFSDDCAWEWVPREDGISCPTPTDCAVAPGEAGRWKISGMRAGHVWVDPDAFHTQTEFVRVLVHEMLHALGLRGHSFVDRFPKSVLRNAYSTILPTDNHVPEIDADGLLAIYTRLAPGAEPETFSATSLEPWGNESQRIHGELNTPDGAAFGVAFRNDLGRPWAVGPEPLSSIAQNQSLRGNATWGGALLGFTPEGSSVSGEAEITVDVGSLTGRADFTEIEEWSSHKSQDSRNWSTWGDGDLGYTIAVSGNTIRETGGDEGVLTGSFVGRKHEGAVGILERQDLSAAFGTFRPRSVDGPNNDKVLPPAVVELPGGHELSNWLDANSGDNVTVPAGGYWDVGSVRFLCSEKRLDCVLTLANDKGGVVVYSTGGQVSADLLSPNWLMPGPGPVSKDSPLDAAARDKLISFSSVGGWQFGTEESFLRGGTVHVGHHASDSAWEWGWWNEIDLSRDIVKVQRRPALGTYASYHDDVTVWGILDNGLFYIARNDNGFGAGYSYSNSWIDDWQEYPHVFFENAKWTGDALGMEKANAKAVSGPAVLTISNLEEGLPGAITLTLDIAFKNIGVDPVQLTKRVSWFNGDINHDGPRGKDLSEEEFRWHLKLLGSNAEEAVGIFETHRYFGSYGLKSQGR